MKLYSKKMDVQFLMKYDGSRVDMVTLHHSPDGRVLWRSVQITFIMNGLCVWINQFVQSET